MRVSPHTLIRPLGLAAVAAAVLAVSGCGASEEPDLVNGKELFVGKGTCGACHTLARAGTKGNRGPSLDESFGPARDDGLGEGTVAGVVEQQISEVRRNSIMPEDLVTGKDARDVAAYVAAVAGQPGEDTGVLALAGRPKVSDKPVVAEGGQAEIAADPTGALAFVARFAEAEGGQVTLDMPNDAPVEHNIAIKGNGVDEKGPVVGKGESSEVSADLQPGKYVFYCSVPGHEEGGMRGELTVK